MHSTFLNRDKNKVSTLLFVFFMILFSSGQVQAQTKSDTVNVNTDVNQLTEIIQNIIDDYGNNLYKWKKDEDTLDITFNTDLYIPRDSLNAITLNITNSKLTITSKSYTNILTKDKLPYHPELLNTIRTKLGDETTLNFSQTIDISLQGLTENNTKRIYNRKLRYMLLGKRFQLGLSYDWSANYRQLSNLYAVSSNSQIEDRNKNEFYLHTYENFNALAGIAVYSHSFLLSYRNKTIGFDFEADGSIDNETGQFSNDGTTGKIESSISSLGLQYEYTNYWNEWSPYVQCGFNAFFKNKNDHMLTDSNRHFFGTSINVGVGISYKPTYCLSMFLSPVAMMMLNREDAQFVSTRYYSLGLETGIRFNIRCLPKKH